MRKVFLFTIFTTLIFLASCGGSSAEGGNTATSETSCTHDGAFSCKENAVFKCENKEWQKIEQCAEDQKCNPVKGICETVDTASDADTDEPDTTSDNPDTDDADTIPDSGDSQLDPDQDNDPSTTDNDEQSTPDSGDSTSDDDETEAVEINDEASCIDAGGIWNSGKCTKSATCTGLPENAVWNKASGIRQTWNGTEWEPSEVGNYSATPSTSECVFKCNKGYLWNGSVCETAPTQTANCTDLPANAQWNTVSSITQTWDGSEWLPTTTGSYSTTASNSECRFKCNMNYNWNSLTSTCESATQEADCSSKLANTVWNDNDRNGKFTQTWNGTDWDPASYTSTYNKTAGTCRYTCATGYIWSENQCITAPTRTANCTGLPANAQWNTATSITQTYDGSEWYPATAGVYDETSSTSECRFGCNMNYNWNSSTSKCDAATQTVNCTGLPTNASWNSASSITQTWSGNEWLPTTTGSYNSTASTNECRYMCKDSYHPENGGSSCVSNTKTNVACTGLPSNAQWNTASSITQTWNGSSWTPTTTGTYNTAASTSQCRYKCKDSYHTEDSGASCISNTKTGVACTGLPSNAQWNTASSITQTWNGSAWTPTATGSFNNTASTSECRFKCNTNYTWQTSNLTCKADSKVSNCTGLPANAVWNTASTISQTWNGSSWQPSTTGSYSTTASTAECYYKCISGYEWNGSECILPQCSETSGTPCKIGGLIWSEKSSDRMNLQSAKTHCSSHSEGGITGWRVPTIDELRTVVQNCSNTITGGTCRITNSCVALTCYSNNCYCSSGSNYSKFGDVSYLWSSTQAQSLSSNDVFVIYFGEARITNYPDSNSIYVRCVRN